MNQFETFAALHKPGNPFFLGNAWNVQTAIIFEKNGYQAIGTSSSAIANSLGYGDGEKIAFKDLFFIVERIMANVSVPVSVDLERGYGKNIHEVIEHIQKLHDIGVAGINLEDSADEHLIPVNIISEKIDAIKNRLLQTNSNVFINLRTDPYLLRLPEAAMLTLERIKAFELAGADGIFVPFIMNEEEIALMVAASSLPLNVLSTPELPPFEILARAGVARISLGSAAFRAAYGSFEKITRNIIEDKSISGLF